VAQVQAQFTHDLFGQGAQFAILQAQADANDAATFQGLLTQLAAQGLDGTAFQMLAASGDIQTAQELLSGGLIDAFEQAIAAQQGAVGSLGSFVGQEAFGTAVREQTAALYTIGRSLESQEAGFTKMVAAVEGVKQSTKDGAYTGTYRGAKDALEGRDARTAAGRR